MKSAAKVALLFDNELYLKEMGINTRLQIQNIHGTNRQVSR